MSLPCPLRTGTRTGLLAALFVGLITPVTGNSQTLEIHVTEAGSESAVENAIVLLESSDQTTAADELEMIQRDRAFHPHTMIVPLGSRVAFPNKDNVQHHVFSFSPAKTFELELYADEPEAPVHFDQPGIVELGCNIHDRMQAFIIVVDTEQAQRTSKDGRTSFDHAGLANKNMVNVRIWHERMQDPSSYKTVTLPVAGSHAVELMLRPSEEDGRFDELQERFSG